ncbi:PilN domain-containing protein [Gilvimarinus polysaccharolyticus]|uniref:PilN domain-containing protein n=1 Tax=Gilvimarinus polysaccharolyticus TaxID=863921 RepID=UPI0018DCCE4B|nr:PilN domain-containing protein [Gilvimarinus polysaccharolyticus]
MSSKNQWELFGFDLSQLGGLLGRVWRDVFWTYHSPIRQKLDEPVLAHRWQADAAAPLLADADKCQAVVLPDTHVLTRHLTLPRAALANLPQIVAAEVTAASPFLADDTAVGQRVDDAGGKTVALSLALASRAGVMSLLHSVNPDIASNDYEIWAESQDKIIILEGFAEPQRNARYLQRLTRLSIYSAVALVAVAVLLALPWMYQSYRLNKIETELQQSRLEARNAMQLRTQLADNNTRINILQTEVNIAAKPLAPLAVLTTSLGDDNWLGSYEQAGNKVTIDGYANDAAALIQQLTANTYFNGVKPLSAIRKVGNDGVERFRLELQLPLSQTEQP